MAFPATLLSNQWTDNEEVNAAKMYARIDTQLNALAAVLDANGQGYLADLYQSTTSTPLTALTTYYPTAAVVTLTLATQRRLRVEAQGTFTCSGSSPARYFIRPAYNSGSSPGTPITFGPAGSCVANATGANGAVSAASYGTNLFPAGTYTIYAAAYRAAGGSTSDSCEPAYVAVYDVGAV